MGDLGYHVGIIPDGNRRWAQARGLPIQEGHRQGTEKMLSAADWALAKPEVSVVTLFMLSEENLERPREELDYLFVRYEQVLRRPDLRRIAEERQVEVKVISTNPMALPEFVRETSLEVEAATSPFGGKKLYTLLGYSGQSEILQALMFGRAFSIPPSSLKAGLGMLSAEEFERGLLVREPCDFIIRSGFGGRMSLSGFLPWQSVYAEYYCIDKYWPDVTEADLETAWRHLTSVERRFGDHFGR